jgi:uncharacterized protein (TIGR02145 family)
MKMKRIITLTFSIVALATVFSNSIFSQVGIGTATPHISAELDITSTNKALLITRVANTAAISNPANGMIIYDLSSNCFKGFQNGAWSGCGFVNASTNGSGGVSAYSCSTASSGILTAGVAVSGVTQTITATVTTVGTYNITAAANGVIFEGSGTFAGTGAQTIVLTATGTPIAIGSHTFTLNTTPNCNFNRTTLVNPSTNGSANVSAYTCSTASTGTLIDGVAVSGVTQTITATVTATGTYNISTSANGITFAGSGTFAGTGAQTIVLTATGTPTAVGTHTFTLNTTPNCNFNRTTNQPSSGGSAVVSTWTSTVGCAVGAGTNNSPAGVRRGAVNQTMVDGIAAPAAASVTLVANVTTAGTYNITTTTVNGVTFSASGTFGGTGSQTVTLTPSGTPTNAGNYKWITTSTPSIDVYGSVITVNAPLGSTYTAHRNGIISGVHVGTTYLNATQTTGETFNNNSNCDDKRISAQGCGGITSVTASSGRVHATVEINGQCWLKTNLITVPPVYPSYTTSSWTATSPGDQGYWGYHHITTTNGSAGWQSTEPATNDGLLYQWCGAMNATISERSIGICPAGFHMPSDCEWMFLEHGQGMSIADQTATGLRANASNNEGTPGYKLRSEGPGFTNASGFSGVLSGFRETDGTYFYYNDEGSFWTSTILNTTSAYCRDLWENFRGVYRVNTNTEKSLGLSVRCLKD